MMRRARFGVAVVAFWLSALVSLPVHAGPTSMCDAIAGGCVEAYSFTHSLIAAYSGPLFQLNNGSSNRDVPQTGKGAADISGALAFCGGASFIASASGTTLTVSKVLEGTIATGQAIFLGPDQNTQGFVTINSGSGLSWTLSASRTVAAGTFLASVPTTCKISKIYAQVNSANNLTPSTVSAPFGPNCSAGGLTCANILAIDPVTQLPILAVNVPAQYVIGGTDALATGVTGTGSSSVSVVYRGYQVGSPNCCGLFGIYHLYSAPDTSGTDYGIVFGFGQLVNGTHCSTTNVYCFGTDEEGSSVTVDLPGSPFRSVLGVIAYNLGANQKSGWVNGVQIFSLTLGVAQNTPPHIHLCGGGDLSQPSQCMAQDMALTNTAMSSSDVSGIGLSEDAFYYPVQQPGARVNSLYNFLLRRDLDPASNDNHPAFLDEVG